MRNGGSNINSADPAPFERFQAGAAGPVFLTCDHASNRIPQALGKLGLDEAELTRHIAWDIGAAEVTREMVRKLGAVAILGGVSRLVIDCNRALGTPTSICEFSDGTEIPVNRNLDAAAIRNREEQWFHPYHAAISAELERMDTASGLAPMICVHSFTPVMAGFSRPWQIGIMWNRDPRLAALLIEALKGRGLEVGDNQPYSAREGGLGYTLGAHGHVMGRPHVAIEIRQSEISDQTSSIKWGGLLAELVAPILALPEMRERRTY